VDRQNCSLPLKMDGCWWHCPFHCNSAGGKWQGFQVNGIWITGPLGSQKFVFNYVNGKSWGPDRDSGPRGELGQCNMQLAAGRHCVGRMDLEKSLHDCIGLYPPPDVSFSSSLLLLWILHPFLETATALFVAKQELHNPWGKRGCGEGCSPRRAFCS
jgi:hypothetical protein